MLTQKHVNDLHSMLTGTEIPKARSKSAQVARFVQDIKESGIKVKANDLQSMDFDAAKAALDAAITEAKLEIPDWLKRTPKNEAEKTAARKAAAKADKKNKNGKGAGKGATPAGDGKRRGRVHEYAGKKFRAKVKENPYREGSARHSHFQILLDNGKKWMTFEDWMAAGGMPGIVKGGLVREYCEMK